MTDETFIDRERAFRGVGTMVLMTIVFFVLAGAMSYLVYFRSLEGANVWDFVAFLALIAMPCVIFDVYLWSSERSLLAEKRKIAAMYTVMTVSLALEFCFASVISSDYGIYCAPFAVCALVIALLINPRCSFYANFTVLLIFFINEMRFSGDATRMYFSLFAGIATGILASSWISRCTRRIQYIVTAVKLGLFSLLIGASVSILFVNVGAIPDGMLQICLFSLLSGAIDIALFMLLVPTFEWLFNLISDFRLAEIASANRPLMKRLRRDAIGTFNHSLLLANYAEACAAAIGEDVFLARAAGYYHDIGKLAAPKFFSENQMGGENPHDSLSPEASVRIIKTHVTKGIALAKEYRLPIEIQKVIAEHHGTLPIMFFYHKANRITEGGEVDMTSYSYDGPKPSSRISAIIMICDACEAALRANNDKSRANEIVEKLVRQRFEQGQFTDCDVTMKQLDIIKETIVTTYIGIEHDRVKYPEQNAVKKDRTDNKD